MMGASIIKNIGACTKIQAYNVSSSNNSSLTNFFCQKVNSPQLSPDELEAFKTQIKLKNAT